MNTAIRLNAGSDPFAKIKGLIEDMIEKLEAEAEADATKEAWCDKEMADSKAKEAEMNNDISKLSTKIDQMSSRSAQLKEEVAAHQKTLSHVAASQAEMNKLRQEENSAFVSNKAEMEQGLTGIKAALKVLRDYYSNSDKAHAEAEGSSTGIIGLLEVCESDFSKGLAELISTEESSQAAYDQETKDNEIETANNQKDVEYKTKEYTGLDKAVNEASSDRAGVETELAAVVEYMKKLDEQCIVKPDTYAEGKRRKEAEIAGLKEALNILENEAASLVQKGRSARRAQLRGGSLQA
eukprot:TRINITY_DN1953_c0_g1_i5.p1 TRINITY_DN1953_c0_g1~~TRINITY_DN1953_c0_g1_i5.p1  ORF type:complete len:295 (+),score=131.77 TRINITY_DN1953_c0_g1_i5:3-887(+)